MRTFIVLIPVNGSVADPRKACELIENSKFKNETPTVGNVLRNVMKTLNLKSRHNIEIEPITDFMDRVNNEEFNPDDYFMSYVYS